MYLKLIIKKANFKGKKGFTLVEVLAAVTLMSISLLFIVQLLSSSMKYNTDSGDITVANNLAQEKIEEYRNNYFTTGEGIAVVPGYSKYKRMVEVIPNKPTTATNIVKVTVTWTSRSGKVNSVVLNTVMEK